MAGMSGPYGPVQQPPMTTYPTSPAYGPSYPPPSMPYAMPYAPRPRRFSTRQIVGLSVGIFGVVLVLAALLGTWWYIGLTSPGTPLSLPVNFGLLGGTFNLIFITLPFGYAGQVSTVFLITMILVLASLALAVVSLILGFVSRNPGVRWASVALSVGAFSLLVAAPLLLMIMLPSAQNGAPVFSLSYMGTGISVTCNVGGLWGSGSCDLFSNGIAGGTVPATASAAWAWYLSLVAGVLVLVAGLMFAPSRATAQAGVAPAPYPTAPQQAQAPTPMPEPWPESPPPSDSRPPPGVGP